MDNQEFYAGDIVHLEIGKNLFCEVKVLDIKRAYGHVRYLVKPVKGQGQIWVETLLKISKWISQPKP